MSIFKTMMLILGLFVLIILPANGKDKYTDENRPYEFGFSIDGEQHRHEKKDENGIIMGEFGFITADGVYHVTVYATDEQGRFKILSMKNIRVKPYPTTASQNSRTGHSLSLSEPDKTTSPPTTTYRNPATEAKQQSLITNTPSNNPQSFKSSSIQLSPKPPASPVKSCSHCSLPTTTTIAPKLPNLMAQTFSSTSNQGNLDSQNPYENKNNYNLPQPNSGDAQTFGGPSVTQGISGEMQYNDANSYFNNDKDKSAAFVPSYRPELNPNNSPNGASNFENSNPNIETTGMAGPSFQQPLNIAYNNNQNQASNTSPNSPLKPHENNGNSPYGGAKDSQTVIGTESVDTNEPTNNRSPKRYEPNSQAYVPQNAIGETGQNSFDLSQIPDTMPIKPMLISAQMQIVDKNTDIYHKNPGERDGLPEGVTKDYVENVLYVFNYTVGFHGHYEKGFANGAKQGYYYVTGRNGVRTRVDYEADEKGFRPKITQEVLDLLSDDVPKPETEKEEKYGLKSYEFKWLYFPVQSKNNK